MSESEPTDYSVLVETIFGRKRYAQPAVSVEDARDEMRKYLNECYPNGGWTIIRIDGGTD